MARPAKSVAVNAKHLTADEREARLAGEAKLKGKGGKLYELIGIDDESDTAEEDAFSFAPVGSGCQDMPAILDASVAAGAEWVVVEQDRPAKGHTPMQSAEMGREYLKTLGW